MKKIFAFLISAFLIAGTAAASSVNVVIRNNTNTIVNKIYVIEAGSEPESQTINLESMSQIEKLKKKLLKQKAKDGESVDESKLDKAELLQALKPEVEYSILLENENGELYLREGIIVSGNSENVLVEFKKLNKVDKRWVSNYMIRFNDEKQRKITELEYKKPQYFVEAIGAILLLIFVCLIAKDLFQHKKNPALPSVSQKFLGANYTGRRIAEVIGVFVMIIPVVLSFFHYPADLEKTYFWFFTHRISKDISVNATMLTMLASVMIYGSYIVRYDFFKRETAEQAIFSLFQAVINCWALAGLCSMFIGNDTWSIPLINISSQTCLVVMIVLSWIGAKSLSGLMWVILILVGISHITEVNSAMGVYGALYIICMFVSLLLQLSNTMHLKDFASDFCEVGRKTGRKAREDIDATAETIKTAVAALVEIATATAITGPAGGVEKVQKKLKDEKKLEN